MKSSNTNIPHALKFLIIAPRFHTNLYYRAKALQDAGHQVKVLALYEGKSEFLEGISFQKLSLSLFSKIAVRLLSGFRKKHLMTGLQLRLLSPNREFKKLIRTYRPDVIILKAFQNLLALKTLIVNKNAKVLLLTQTDKTHIKGSKFLFKLNMQLFRRLGVDAYLTPIKSNYDAFKKFGIENVYYSPFVYPQQTKKQKTETKNDVKIISVGKYVRRKDQKTLILACENLIKEKHITIDFYGEKADKTYYEELKKLIAEKELGKNIKLFTNIKYEGLQKIYGNYDIFVLPSYAEPAAYSIVEAMAHGLPVICSDECGTRCYIEQGRNGEIFMARNVEDLEDKIRKVISETKNLNPYHCFSKQHKLKNFSQIIEKIIKSNKNEINEDKLVL